MALLPSSQYQIDKNGHRLADSAVTSLKHDDGKGVELPVDMYVVHEAAPDRDLPDLIRIDCTGLGGHELGGPDPWHICLRTDRHGQNIYGPSLTTTEEEVHHPMKWKRHMVALGLTKAMHEFLTLHYFASDSVTGWDELLERRLPAATWMKSDARRLMAIDMFGKSHIAPSHRRLPHLSWTTSISLLMDLLIGAGKTRYLNTRPHAHIHRNVFVRGFSAGSKLHFDRFQTTDWTLRSMDADSIKAMSTPCIYILVVSLLQELALRSSLIMSPVTIVQEVDGGLATFDTHEAEGVLEVETEEHPDPPPWRRSVSSEPRPREPSFPAHGPLLFLVDLPWLPSLASPLLFASTQSVHSGPLGLLRVLFLSLLPLCSLGSVGHSGPLSPLLCTCFHFSFLCFSSTA